jgi:hypothetical protein
LKSAESDQEPWGKILKREKAGFELVKISIKTHLNLKLRII